MKPTRFAGDSKLRIPLVLDKTRLFCVFGCAVFPAPNQFHAADGRVGGTVGCGIPHRCRISRTAVEVENLGVRFASVVLDVEHHARYLAVSHDDAVKILLQIDGSIHVGCRRIIGIARAFIVAAIVAAPIGVVNFQKVGGEDGFDLFLFFCGNSLTVLFFECTAATDIYVISAEIIPIHV